MPSANKYQRQGLYEVSMKARQSETTKSFLLAEYSALRAELLKRIELQHQMISLALIAAGTFLSVGIQFDSATIILIYPILAMFLASAWSQSDFWIRRIAFHIHFHIEEVLAGNDQGWEHNNHPGSKIPFFGSLSLFASRGIFIGTQVLAIFVAWLRTGFPLEDQVLMVVDILIIVLTLVLLRRR